MNKKVIGITVIIIIFAIVVALIINKNVSKAYTIENITTVDYMVIKNKNKSGVINKNGDVIVEPEYDEIEIPNPSKPVFICKYGFDVSKNEYNVRVFNEKKEHILYQYYIVEAIKLDWDTSENPYEKSVLKFKKNGKYGVIDFDGNIIVKAKYDEISGLKNQEGLLLVKKNNKYGVINIRGDYILKEKYDIIEPSTNYLAAENINNLGFIVANKDSNNKYKYGFVSSKGKKILDFKFNQIEVINKKTADNSWLFIAFEDDKAKLYKNDKCIINDACDDIIYNEYSDCLVLEKNSKQGLAKLDGNIILPVEYDNIFLSGKYINTRKDNTVAIFNINNMEKIEVSGIVGLLETQNEKYAVAITDNDNYKIFDCENRNLEETEYDEVAIQDVSKDGKKLYFGSSSESSNSNIEGKSLYPNNVGEYIKEDLGYGQPYYIKKSNEEVK